MFTNSSNLQVGKKNKTKKRPLIRLPVEQNVLCSKTVKSNKPIKKSKKQRQKNKDKGEVVRKVGVTKTGGTALQLEWMSQLTQCSCTSWLQNK